MNKAKKSFQTLINKSILGIADSMCHKPNFYYLKKSYKKYLKMI
jgi:hypothetical protein